jgi:hypothetical protein
VAVGLGSHLNSCVNPHRNTAAEQCNFAEGGSFLFIISLRLHRHCWQPPYLFIFLTPSCFQVFCASLLVCYKMDGNPHRACDEHPHIPTLSVSGAKEDTDFERNTSKLGGGPRRGSEDGGGMRYGESRSLRNRTVNPLSPAQAEAHPRHGREEGVPSRRLSTPYVHPSGLLETGGFAASPNIRTGARRLSCPINIESPATMRKRLGTRSLLELSASSESIMTPRPATRQPDPRSLVKSRHSLSPLDNCVLYVDPRLSRERSSR